MKTYNPIEGITLDDRILFKINIVMAGGIAPDFSEIRKHLKLTLRTVEAETGISNAYLSQMENRHIKKPSFETVMKLYKYYVDKLRPNINDIQK